MSSKMMIHDLLARGRSESTPLGARPGVRKAAKRALNKAKRSMARSYLTSVCDSVTVSDHPLISYENAVFRNLTVRYDRVGLDLDELAAQLAAFDDDLSLAFSGLPEWVAEINFEEKLSLKGLALGHGPDTDERIEGD